MTNNLPDVYTGTAFNAEPFDPAGVPVWVDLSTRYTGTGSATRGRDQYELDQSQTGTADMTWFDQDEALNPTNTSSPYAPNVVPYRPLLWRVMWPPSGAGNILPGASIDGSFESYFVPNTPGWFAPLLNLAGAQPAAGLPFLVNAGAWQGTKAAQIVIGGAATTKPAGASFSVPVIPGKQYTAQVHVNQTTASPFQLAIGNQTIAVDPFTRVTAAGWGTPPPVFGFGPTWSAVGTAANFSTGGGLAVMSHTVVNTRLTALQAATGANQSIMDSRQWVTVNIPVLATGQAIQASIYSRYTSSLNNYACLISFNTDGTVTLTAQKEVGGVFTTIGSNVTLSAPYVAGDSYRLRMDTIGPDIWLKAWKVTTPASEPLAWTIQGSDNALTVPGKVGCTSIVTTGNTNTLPVALTFSDYRAIGSIVDTTAGVTSATGSYQLLTQTFTASQPTVTFTVQTQAAPAAANTILVDGLQVEPGAVANTFTTSGPVVRSPWTRGYIERYPIQWDADSNGYLGVMQGPAVGPFFILQNATLHAEYRGALMAKSPAYYWPLNESDSAATSFSEQSGNGGTSLYRYDALEGGATSFAPGTQSNIPGDPSGVGLAIGPAPNPPVSGGTILSTNQWGLGQALSGLGGTGLSWGLTISLWLASPNPTITSTVLPSVFSLRGNPDDPTACVIITQMLLPPSGTPGPDFQFGNNAAGITFGRPAGTSSGLDGNPHHYVFTINMASNNITMTVYRDGSLYGTPSNTNVSATFGTSTLNANFTLPSLSGSINRSGSSTSLNSGIYGTYEHLALFNRALTAAEVADLWAAGQGYPNENSGTRVARYVALAGFTGLTDIAQGLTTMGVSTLQEGTQALDACQSIQDTEFGNLYEYQDGIAFRGRQARYLTASASYVFGDAPQFGEYPYLGSISYDFDPTYVFNAAALSRVGGSTAYAVDSTGRSQMRYGSRTFTRDMGGNSDLEVQDLANFVVANSKDARPRLAALVFDAGATRGVSASPDGTLWYMLLSLEPGTRVTVKRRPKAANGGLGYAMVGDFFVESVSPGTIDYENGTWLVTLLLSPAPVSSQPWILEDSIYGVLDSTTVLGA